MSERDKIALQLADNNSKYYRDRKMKAMEQVRSSLKAGKAGSAAGLSPAAKRLASGKLGIRLGTDPMLRASYTPSPSSLRRPGQTPTPSRTPSATPGSKSKVTPKLGVRPRTKTPGTGKSSSDITDNLLDINLSKDNDRSKVNTDDLLKISKGGRSRASDFFSKKK